MLISTVYRATAVSGLDPRTDEYFDNKYRQRTIRCGSAREREETTELPRRRKKNYFTNAKAGADSQVANDNKFALIL